MKYNKMANLEEGADWNFELRIMRKGINELIHTEGVDILRSNKEAKLFYFQIMKFIIKKPRNWLKTTRKSENEWSSKFILI